MEASDEVEVCALVRRVVARRRQKSDRIDEFAALDHEDNDGSKEEKGKEEQKEEEGIDFQEQMAEVKKAAREKMDALKVKPQCRQFYFC